MKSALWIVLCLFFLPYIYGDSTTPEKAPVGWHSANLEDGITSGIDLNVSHSGKGSGFLSQQTQKASARMCKALMPVSTAGKK